MISFTFDDGRMSTLTHAAPILREFGMTGTVGVICNRLLWRTNSSFMGVDDLRQLVDDEWEIALHSLFHRRLPQLPPYYGDEVAEWRYDADAGAFVADCRWEDIGTVVHQGKYLQRADCIQQLLGMAAGFALDPQHAKVYARTGEASGVATDLRLGSAEREIAESRPVLEAEGFKVNSFIVPFSMWPEQLQPLGARYYPIIATVRKRLNNLNQILPTQLSRIQIRNERSAVDVIKILKHHRAKNSWGIICFHGIESVVGRRYDWTPSEFRRVVKWVAASNEPVVTLSSGATRLANWGQHREIAAPQTASSGAGAA